MKNGDGVLWREDVFRSQVKMAYNKQELTI